MGLKEHVKKVDGAEESYWNDPQCGIVSLGISQQLILWDGDRRKIRELSKPKFYKDEHVVGYSSKMDSFQK